MTDCNARNLTMCEDCNLCVVVRMKTSMYVANTATRLMYLEEGREYKLLPMAALRVLNMGWAERVRGDL